MDSISSNCVFHASVKHSHNNVLTSASEPSKQLSRRQKLKLENPQAYLQQRQRQNEQRRAKTALRQAKVERVMLMGIEVEYDTVIQGQMEKARARYQRYNQGPKRKGQNRPKLEKPYIPIRKLSPEKAEKMRSWKRNEKRRIALQLFTARNEARDCLSQFQQKVDDAHNQLNFAISLSLIHI